MNTKPIIIFGYAALGKKLYERLKSENPDRELLFCDNSGAKQGEHDGVKVLPFKEAVKNFGDANFMAASLRHEKQMREQLLDAGISDAQIMDIPSDVMGEELAKEQKQRLVPLKSIHIEVNINKDCNLNCKGCDHFAPIADADTLELDIFERDVERLSDIMAGHIHRVILLGGEPLLNKNLPQYVKIARNNMPKVEVFIATNGTLLGKMGEDFWATLKETNTGLMVTQYPIKLDYEGLRVKAEEKGIAWEYLGSSEGGRSLWKFPLDFTGSQDAMESFIRCANANHCHTLERGRLYTCSIAPNIAVFNKRFKKNVPLTEKDGIDIYKAKSAEEILNYLAKPMPFCSYCNVKGRTYDHPWSVSKCAMEEWA